MAAFCGWAVTVLYVRDVTSTDTGGHLQQVLPWFNHVYTCLYINPLWAGAHARDKQYNHSPSRVLDFTLTIGLKAYMWSELLLLVIPTWLCIYKYITGSQLSWFTVGNKSPGTSRAIPWHSPSWDRSHSSYNCINAEPAWSSPGQEYFSGSVHVMNYHTASCPLSCQRGRNRSK